MKAYMCLCIILLTISPLQCPSYLKIRKENKNENMEEGGDLEFTIDFLALDLHKIEEKYNLKCQMWP